MSIDFKEKYLNWLAENIDQHRINDDVSRLTLPYMNRNNDYMDIYVIRLGDAGYRITDDGWTISDLKMSGFDVTGSPSRKALLTSVLTAYGVTMSDDSALCIEGTLDELALKKHLLTQCILKVDDMYYLSKNNVQSVFLEDVKGFLESRDVRYVENISFVGKSKLQANYDFVIPHSGKYPERLIKTVGQITPDAARSIIFTWNDTKAVRTEDSRLYTFIRDEERKSEDAIHALSEYEISPVFWSEREDFVERLAS